MRNRLEDVSEQEGARVNVGKGERVASVLAGSALTLLSARRKGLARAFALLSGGALIARGVSGHCQVYSRLGIDSTERGKAAHKNLLAPHPQKARAVVRIGKEPEEVYAFCRALDNLRALSPRLDELVASPETGRPGHLRLVKGVAPKASFAMRAEEPGRVLRWEADANRFGRIEGRFHVEPELGGTRLTLDAEVTPPGGWFGGQVAHLARPVLKEALKEALRRIKSQLEAGEVPTIEGQPSGRAEPVSRVVKGSRLIEKGLERLRRLGLEERGREESLEESLEEPMERSAR